MKQTQWRKMHNLLCVVVFGFFLRYSPCFTLSVFLLFFVVMEKYSRSTRFCLICNYIHKIIPALQSRCTKFRFAPLKPELIQNRLREIAHLEGCALSLISSSIELSFVFAPSVLHSKKMVSELWFVFQKEIWGSVWTFFRFISRPVSLFFHWVHRLLFIRHAILLPLLLMRLLFICVLETLLQLRSKRHWIIFSICHSNQLIKVLARVFLSELSLHLFLPV